MFRKNRCCNSLRTDITIWKNISHQPRHKTICINNTNRWNDHIYTPNTPSPSWAPESWSSPGSGHVQRVVITRAWCFIALANRYSVGPTKTSLVLILSEYMLGRLQSKPVAQMFLYNLLVQMRHLLKSWLTCSCHSTCVSEAFVTNSHHFNSNWNPQLYFKTIPGVNVPVFWTVYSAD